MKPDNPLLGPLFFRIWVGYGAGLYAILSFWLAWRAGPPWLVATILLWLGWWWETATGLCRRCTHYNCGPHGAVMRRYFSRNSSPLSPGRRMVHLAGDLLIVAWPQFWIWEFPLLGLASLVWFVVGVVACAPWSDVARGDTAKFGRILPPPAS